MTDISKLKAEAEEARNEAAVKLQTALNNDFMNRTQTGIRAVADALILATIKQIALQAAEKEAGSANVRMAMQNIVLVDPTPIADDTWIKWEGGECPIKDDSIVFSWECRDGMIVNGDNKASVLRWKHTGSPSDIIAYRIVSPAADRI